MHSGSDPLVWGWLGPRHISTLVYAPRRWVVFWHHNTTVGWLPAMFYMARGFGGRRVLDDGRVRAAAVGGGLVVSGSC